jgi:Tfp pilus assembly protein PilX
MRYTMSTIKKLNQSESGIASLMITLILMIVISLVVLGFAQVARREQRGSLDRQLSTQAFYAAESGVNDVKTLLQSIPASSIQVKKNCLADTSEATYNGLKYTLDNGTSVSYSCILVTPYVPQLVKQPLDADTDWVAPVVPVTNTGAPNTLSSLNLQWTPQQGNANPAAGCQLGQNQVAAGRSCGYSLIRFEIAPTDTLSRTALASQDKVFFLYPTTAGSSTVDFSTATGTQISAACGTTAGSTCNVTVNGLSGHATYYVRAHALYTGTNLTITGNNNSGSAVNFSGAQVQIDSTGKAQDVLRRVRVNYSLTGGGQDSYAQYAINSRDSLCKRFGVAPGIINKGGALDTENPPNDYCGAPPVPLPTPTPSGGNAGIKATCGVSSSEAATSDCPTDGPPPGGSYHYNLQLQNVSKNSSSAVVGCTWDWGDGTIQNLPASDPACQQGQWSDVHIFPKLAEQPYPLSCDSTGYRVILTMHLSNGQNPQDYRDMYLPFCY